MFSEKYQLHEIFGTFSIIRGEGASRKEGDFMRGSNPPSPIWKDVTVQNFRDNFHGLVIMLSVFCFFFRRTSLRERYVHLPAWQNCLFCIGDNTGMAQVIYVFTRETKQSSLTKHTRKIKIDFTENITILKWKWLYYENDR